MSATPGSRQPSLWHASGIALWNPGFLYGCFILPFVVWGVSVVVKIADPRFIGHETLDILPLVIPGYVLFMATVFSYFAAVGPVESKDATRSAPGGLYDLLPLSPRRKLAMVYFSFAFYSTLFGLFPLIVILCSRHPLLSTLFACLSIWLACLGVVGLLSLLSVISEIRFRLKRTESIAIGLMASLVLVPYVVLGLKEYEVLSIFMKPMGPSILLAIAVFLAFLNGLLVCVGPTGRLAQRPRDRGRRLPARRIPIWTNASMVKRRIPFLSVHPESAVGIVIAASSVCMLAWFVGFGFFELLFNHDERLKHRDPSQIYMFPYVLGFLGVLALVRLFAFLRALPCAPDRVVGWIHGGLAPGIVWMFLLGIRAQGGIVEVLLVVMGILVLGQWIALFCLFGSVIRQEGQSFDGFSRVPAYLCVGLPSVAFLSILGHLLPHLVVLPMLVASAALNAWLMHWIWRRT